MSEWGDTTSGQTTIDTVTTVENLKMTTCISTDSIQEQNTARNISEGMYHALWDKIEKCEAYVDVLVDAQDQLQATITNLLAELQQVEQAKDTMLIECCTRLKGFPDRITNLQMKLETINQRVIAMRIKRASYVNRMSKYEMGLSLNGMRPY